jgi:hypothetical protein
MENTLTKQEFLLQSKQQNLNVCSDYIRGCRNTLSPEYTKKKCEQCLEKSRLRDRQRRGKAVDTTINDNKKKCSKCTTEKELECFKGVNGGMTKTCNTCRENNKKQDVKRDKEHRNAVARIAESKPERKTVKKAWAENNHEKVTLKGMNYRQRQIENDVDGYQRKQAENARKWREQNPERNIEIKRKLYDSTNGQYNIYKSSAYQRNIDFCLDFQLYESIVFSPCVYCNQIQERGFNGIDRVDSTIGYIETNCQSCCQMCNYMKGCCGVDYFLKKVEHILTFNGKISGNLCYEVMPNSNSRYYSDCKHSAITRNKSFEISREVFDKVRLHDCYLCGKKNSPEHRNGIDRVDNNIGYTEENVKSCCWDCNGLKRDYSLDDLFDKIIKIHENTKNDNINDTKASVDNKRKIVNEKKKTKEEIREAAKLRKKKQRERLKEKYGDEEYKKMRAKELADFRKSKK